MITWQSYCTTLLNYKGFHPFKLEIKNKIKIIKNKIQLIERYFWANILK